MTDDRSLERVARSWLVEGPTQAPDRPVTAALSRIQATRQERGLGVPWRIHDMPRLATFAAAALVVVAGATWIAVGGLNAPFGGDPSAAASPTPTPTPTPAPSPFAVRVVALNIAFDKLELDVPAGAPFVIDFRNLDAPTIVHTIEVRRLISGAVVQDQSVIEGGREARFQYDPLPPGKYTFICAVHPIPGMSGTLTVR